MYRRILVAVDGSATSTRALDEAIRLARSTGGRLCLLHVCDQAHYATGFETGEAFFADVVPFARKTGDAILAEARERATGSDVPAETVLLECVGGSVAAMVAERAKAWGADLIVAGTHGRRGVGRALLGSDAENILRSSPVPVLMVRSSD